MFDCSSFDISSWTWTNTLTHNKTQSNHDDSSCGPSISLAITPLIANNSTFRCPHTLPPSQYHDWTPPDHQGILRFHHYESTTAWSSHGRIKVAPTRCGQYLINHTLNRPLTTTACPCLSNILCWRFGTEKKKVSLLHPLLLQPSSTRRPHLRSSTNLTRRQR